MLKKLENKINKIKDTDLLSVDQIVSLGVVLNTKLEPSPFTLYRWIKRGQLQAMNMGTGKSSRYFVRGKDLKTFLLNRYAIK